MSQYRVRRPGLDTLVTGTTYNDTGLLGGNTYTYQVSAIGPTGLEGAAATASATTPPPTVGGLQVFTQTTGSASASYTLVLEGAGSRQTAVMSANDQVTFGALAPGPYDLILIGAPAGCTIADPNPRTETVQLGVLTQSVFMISCGGGGP